MTERTSTSSSISLHGDKMTLLLQKKTKELIAANSDIIKLQRSCEELKTDVQLWKTKSDNLAQKCTHLARLVKKFMRENTGDKSDHNYSINSSHSKVQKSKKRISQDAGEPPNEKKTKESSREMEPNNATIKEDLDTPETTSIIAETDNKGEEEVSNAIPNLPNRVLNSDQPKPTLNVKKTERGLEVHWDFSEKICHNDIKAYELYAVDCSAVSPSWKKVGLINSIKLPIKVTLSDFKSGRAYYFAVRTLNQAGSPGPYSDVQNISLN